MSVSGLPHVQFTPIVSIIIPVAAKKKKRHKNAFLVYLNEPWGFELLKKCSCSQVISLA